MEPRDTIIMPTNLPPEYFEVERRYKAAESTAEKITCLEELISTVPKHKGTDHLRADLRKRLSKLKTVSQTHKSTGGRESAFHIDREGAGRAMVVGPANVGKSTLVATMTHATPEVSAAPFTTWIPTPGMMPVDDIQIQLIDTPPLSREYIEPALFDLIRSADLILAVVDLQAYPDQQLEDTISILQEHRIAPSRLKDRYTEQQRMTFIPLLVVVNKNDDERWDEDFDIFCELLEEEWPLLPVSAATGRYLERFVRVVFDRMNVIRIYSKPPGKEPDLSRPFVLHKGDTVSEFAGQVHQDFIKNLKNVRIWGSDVYDGQMVGRDHVLHDGDVVELHR